MNKIYSDYTKDDLKEIKIEKMTIFEIADYLGCSVSKTRNILIWLNLNNSFLRPKHYKKIQIFNMNVEDFKYLLSIKTIKDIAKDNNCTIKSIKDFMNKNKIKVNRKKSEYTKRLCTIYDHMRNRCYKENDNSFKYYGKRGIIICDEWLNNRKSFYKWAIQSGYKEHLTLDRIDVNGNYEPSNCRWITMQEQNNNKINNRYLTYKGKTMTFSQWEKQLGFRTGTLRDRIDRYGYSEKEAIEKPIKNKRQKSS